MSYKLLIVDILLTGVIVAIGSPWHVVLLTVLICLFALFVAKKFKSEGV